MKVFNHTKQTGFTLIELLITISIMAIIASIALPSFKNQIAKRKMEDAINQIESCFKDSKIQANILHGDVKATLSSGSGKETLTCGKSSGYELSEPLSVIAVNGTNSMNFSSNGTVAFIGGSATTEETFQVCYQGYDGSSVNLTINARGRMSKEGRGRTCV